MNISDLPIVVQKSKSVRIGGESATKITDELAVDIQTQGLSDIRHMIQIITAQETEAQIKAGNPVSSFLVDARSTKPLHSVQYKTQVFFGTFLQHAIIRQAEAELRKAILKVTTPQTGALSDTRKNWEWAFAEDRTSPYKPINPFTLSALGTGARLALRPKVNYAGWASIVNRRSAKTAQRTYAQVKGREGKRSKDSFMTLAALKLRNSRAFKGAFTVYATFSRAPSMKVAGDTYPFGVPILIIRPRLARGRGRR